MILIPFVLKALIAASLPKPTPFTSTAASSKPIALALEQSSSTIVVAANGVAFLGP